LIPVIAHELHHATELLESGARTSAEISTFFGRDVLSSNHVHETEAAQRVERQVATELARQR